MGTNEQRFDHVVIGAGASGCAVAARLTERSGATVLLLEAGGPATNPAIAEPGRLAEIWGSDLDWKITTSPQPGLGGRQVLINQGRVIGGSTAINALMWVRGNRRNFDSWSADGAAGWGYDDLLPYFQRVEDYTGRGTEGRGRGGPISVVDNPDPASSSQPFLTAAVEIGYDGPAWDYNGSRQEDGAGLLQFSMTPGGSRVTSTAYLDLVRGRPGLTVATGAEVSRLVFDGSRVTGVEYRSGNETHVVGVDREVIVSAGALATPRILLLSGIGPEADLRALGIPVVSDLPGVGANLRDHLQMPVVFAATGPMPTPELLTGNALFVNTRRDRAGAAPDLQLNFTPAVARPLVPILNIPIPVGIFLPIMVQPDSAGSVRLGSADPSRPAIVDPNYLGSPADLATMVAAVGLIREMVATAAMRDVYRGAVVPAADADIEAYTRANAVTLWHPAGTCRIGSDSLAVVDSALRVRGVDGLRVADASVMPNVPSGNTQAACYVIGEKAADLILA